MRKQHLFLFIVLIHIIYFIFALAWGNIYTGDSDEYLYQANNLRYHFSTYSGDLEEPIKTKLYTLRAPFYPMVIMFSKFIYNSDWTILIFQNLLSIINLLLIINLLSHFKFKFNIYPWIALSLILFPTQFIYANMVMSEIIFQSLILLAFLSIYKYLSSSTIKYLLLFNILISLALLTKPVMLYFWIPNLLFSFWLFYKYRKPAIIFLALLLPATGLARSYHNLQTTGYFHYSSIKSFYILTCTTYCLVENLHGTDSAKAFRKKVEIEAATQLDFGNQDKYILNECKKVIQNNIVPYAVYHAKGMVNFFIDPGRYDMLIFFRMKHTEQEGFINLYKKKGMRGVLEYFRQIPMFQFTWLTLIFFLNTFIFFGFMRFVFTQEMSITIKVFLIMIVLYLSFVAGFTAYARFKIQMYPLLLFTLPFFMSWIREVLLRLYTSRQ